MPFKRTPKICTVVTAPTLLEFLRILEKVQQNSDLVELRVDYIKDLSPDAVRIIHQQTYRPSIFCCRAKTEGGEFTGSRVEQRALLETATELGFSYLDIDWMLAESFKLERKRSLWILSHHDFVSTPSLEALVEIQKKMCQQGADILKFAVMNHTIEDAMLLLKFLLAKPHEQNMIVVGMGEAGKIVRILSPYLGAYLTFAAADQHGSAPGQIPYEALKRLYTQLNAL